MRTVSCYGYATHTHISFDVSTRNIDGCTLLLQLWTPGYTCTWYSLILVETYGPGKEGVDANGSGSNNEIS